MRFMATLYYEEYICRDDDLACIDDDLACVDADDAVCDDDRDGLLPHEVEEYEKEQRILNALHHILCCPYNYGLTRKTVHDYVSTVGYY